MHRGTGQGKKMPTEGSAWSSFLFQQSSTVSLFFLITAQDHGLTPLVPFDSFHLTTSNMCIYDVQRLHLYSFLMALSGLRSWLI